MCFRPNIYGPFLGVQSDRKSDVLLFMQVFESVEIRSVCSDSFDSGWYRYISYYSNALDVSMMPRDIKEQPSLWRRGWETENNMPRCSSRIGCVLTIQFYTPFRMKQSSVIKMYTLAFLLCCTILYN